MRALGIKREAKEDVMEWDLKCGGGGEMAGDSDRCWLGRHDRGSNMLMVCFPVHSHCLLPVSSPGERAGGFLEAL